MRISTVLQYVRLFVIVTVEAAYSIPRAILHTPPKNDRNRQ